MTQDKYEQLWKSIIKQAIDDYLKENADYKLVAEEEKKIEAFKKSIWNVYEQEYKPQFKDKCMAEKNEDKKDDFESEDNVKTADGKEIKIDRHKVAALLYISIVCNDTYPFLKLKEKRDNDNLFGKLACHEIAYSVSLNCIHSFIEESYRRNPNCPHKSKFLKNGGFVKTPDLICEKYTCYRESIIPRMVWATEGFKKPHNLVSANVNMLANIFYFLELHSAS